MAGLFDVQDPQQIRNDYMRSQMVSPAQMGSQSLLQQLSSQMSNAGTVIGSVAGGMMGGQVPGEAKATYLNEAIQAGASGKTPAEKMKLIASALEGKPGMGAEYMKAITEARRLEAEDFTMEDAKFKRDNRTREMKETKMVPDGFGGETPKQFYWTENYNQKTGKWEAVSMPSTTPPKGEDKPKVLTPQEQAAAQIAKNKAAKEGKGKTTAAPAPQSVDEFVAASTSNNNTVATKKQDQLDITKKEEAVKAADISSLDKLTPSVISGLTRKQAIDVFKRYKKNLTKEQTDAILEKAGARRFQFR